MAHFQSCSDNSWLPADFSTLVDSHEDILFHFPFIWFPPSPPAFLSLSTLSHLFLPDVIILFLCSPVPVFVGRVNFCAIGCINVHSSSHGNRQLHKGWVVQLLGSCLITWFKLYWPYMEDIIETGNNYKTGRVEKGEDKSSVVFMFVFEKEWAICIIGSGEGLWCQPLFPGSCHSVGPCYHQGSVRVPQAGNS